MNKFYFNIHTILTILLLTSGCGEIVSSLDYSSVKGANLSWTSSQDISSTNISAYPVAGQCVPQYNDVTVSVGDPVVSQQIFACVDGRFNGAMDLSAAGLAEGPVEVGATQISLSAAAMVQVLVDTIIPVAPTIVTPANGSTTTNVNQSVTGTCETGSVVNLSGDFTGSPLTAACVASAYVLSINLILGNGPKSISANQTDGVGNISPAAMVTINLGIPPTAPTITSPTAGLLTNSTALTISGACESGATVNISGDVVGAPISTFCLASNYSQAITLTVANGAKSLVVNQTNTAGTSPSTNRILNLDTTAPTAPTITTPANGSLTNLTAQTVTGACETGAVLSIYGDIVGSPVAATCVASSYSRAITLVTGDGAKNINATQTDPAGNTSGASNSSITLDQTAPSAPTITSPLNGSYTNTTARTIVGACETGATVNISGAIVGSPVTTSCVASAYSRAVTLTSGDGSKTINATQTDVANNTSTSTSISMILDTMAPAAPGITSPANGSSVNTTSRTITGTCVSGLPVDLSGSFTPSPVSVGCVSSSYSRMVTLTAGDGAKAINATQTDLAGNTSATTTISVNLDTASPSAPTITSPLNNSFTNATPQTVVGACETGSTVNLSGPFSGSPLTASCVASAYSRAITLTGVDGAKVINATQTDPAGNTSAATNISITLDRSNPAPPTITSPVNGVTATSASQTVSGACETGATLEIWGNLVGSPLFTVCSASAYSLGVTLTAAYGVKTINAHQTDPSGNSSTPVSVTVNYTNLNVTYPATFTNQKYTPLNFPSTGISPTVVTGTPTSYSISPALPTGLSLNTTSGLISGTPNVSDDVGKTYTITINDAIGTIQRTMFLRIAIPDYTWMGTAGDGLWNTAGNWRINAVPPATAFTYFDDECLVSGNCNANINVNSQIRRVYMKPTYTGTITQNPGITFQVGSRSSNGNFPNDWAKWEMEAGIFVGGNSALTIDRINIIGGTFTSTSGTLRLGSNHTFVQCNTGGPSWDWKSYRDCGFSLSATATFNHNNGTIHVNSSATTYVRRIFAFWLDQPLNIVNLIFENNTNLNTGFDGRANGAEALIYGSSKLINLSTSLLWKDGNLAHGQINYQGLNAIFECDAISNSDRCADYKAYGESTTQPENVEIVGVEVHTWIRFNRNDGSPQTYTFDDGAAIVGIIVDNPNGVNPVPTNPGIGYLRLGKLELRQGVFTAPPDLSFGDGFDCRYSTAGINSSLGLIMNGGGFNHNNGLVSFDAQTIYDDNRAAIGILAVGGITFNDVEVNITADSDLDGTGDGLQVYLYPNSVINILGDLNIHNGRFRTVSSNRAIINLYGDLNFWCANPAQKDCYGASDYISVNLVGNTNTQMYFESMGGGYLGLYAFFAINKTMASNRVTLIGDGGQSPTAVGSPTLRITNGIFDLGIYRFNHGHSFINNGVVQCSVGVGYLQYVGGLSGTPQPGNTPACYGP